MAEFTHRILRRIQIIGGDCQVSNAEVLCEAVSQNTCYAALIRLNQAGPISEAIAYFDATVKECWGRLCLRDWVRQKTSGPAICLRVLVVGSSRSGLFIRSERMLK